MSGIELQGVDAFLADIRRRLGAASAKVESKALREAGELIAQEERSIVAVSDQGPHIRDDIYVSRVARKDGMKYVLVRQSKKTSWRGHFLEFGTSKMAAQPYKDPAFRARRSQAIQVLVDAFKGGLKGG